MRVPISVSHEKHYYRVIFRSLDPRAAIPLDDERETRMKSRTHVLKLGKRDYDVLSETEQDAAATARYYLACDRVHDGTKDHVWTVDSVSKY